MRFDKSFQNLLTIPNFSYIVILILITIYEMGDRMGKFLLVGGGFFFLGLGAIGLLLPVWPTTPFVLLSAACFSCAPAMRARIMRIAFFREHIENYGQRRGLSRKTLCISLGYLWGMLLLSMVVVKQLWVCVLLACIGAAVTMHLLWMARAKRGAGE